MELLRGVPIPGVVRADCVESPPAEIVVELRESMDLGVDEELPEAMEFPEAMVLLTSGTLDDEETGSKSDVELVFWLLFSVSAVEPLPRSRLSRR